MQALLQLQQRLWLPVSQLLRLLQSPALLAARAYVAYVFFISGLTKLGHHRGIVYRRIQSSVLVPHGGRAHGNRR
jgi:uncharacterized membrane protein YphA (DoxX/SURF4 family)